MGATALNNAAVLLRLCGLKVLGIANVTMWPWDHGHGYRYGYIGMRMVCAWGMAWAWPCMRAKWRAAAFWGWRWCGAHIQKAEPLGTLPFVSSLWWLLKS